MTEKETDESLYRSEALAEYAEAQQSYHLTQIITPQSWITLTVLGIFLIAGLFWFCFGVVTTRIQGEGLLVWKTGSIYSVNLQGADGEMQSVNIVSSQKVTKGQVLGTMHASGLIDQIQPTQKLVNELHEQYQHLGKNAPIGLRTTLRTQIMQEESKLSILKKRLARASIIKSPIDGEVFWVMTQPGDYVKDGQNLFTISPNTSSSHRAILAQAYIPLSQGKRIKKGMLAEVVPSFTQELAYGAIKGKVIQVGAGPENQQTMSAFLKNKALLKRFSGDEPVIMVRIQLDKNPKNFSGFDWTASNGPHTHLTVGTLVSVSILAEREHPISLILPRLE